MKLVDVPDSKSGVGNYVPVRPRPSANKTDSFGSLFYCINVLDSKKGGEPARVGSSASELRLEQFCDWTKSKKQNAELPFNASDSRQPRRSRH